MTRNKIIAVVIATAGLAFSYSVGAVPVVFCSNGGIDLTVGCVSGESRFYPGGGDGVYSNSGGGDPESAVEAAILAATGVFVDISLYGKSDDNPGLFSFTGFPGNSGTWDVLDLIDIAYITIKASNSFALYDVGGANFGNWTTAGLLNNGGSQPGVSHISFWLARSPSREVPEPSSLALLGLGLIGVGVARRRRRNV